MAKKKEIYYGKGLKRIYFALGGVWIALWLTYAFYGNLKTAWDMKIFAFNIALPFALYFVLLFFIKGFKK